MSDQAWLVPPGLPAGVRVVSTTRVGGLGGGSFATLSLGGRQAGAAARVEANRARLRRTLALPAEPVWLRQGHGDRCVSLTGGETADVIAADAACTAVPGVVCAVLTADCLPVVLVERDAAAVAVAHAGWRGLAGGILESTVAALALDPSRLAAWLGPAIGPRRFEVGPEVRAAFVDHDAGAARAFRPGHGDRWYADLYALARRRLHALGITRIRGGDRCTAGEPAAFFSARRDGTNSGRMATLAWRES